MITAMKPAIRQGPQTGASASGGRSRVLAVGAALALSLLLHLVLLRWVGEHWAFPGQEASVNAPEVSVALIPGPAVVAPVAGQVPASPPAPRTRPRPKRVEPSSASITPERPVVAEPPTLAESVKDEAQGAADAAGAEDPAKETGEPADAASGTSSPSTQEVGRRSEPELPMPPIGRWRLRVHYGNYRTTASLAVFDYRIEVDGDRYRASSEGRAEGLTALIYSGVLSQSSTGRLTPHGLAPERYTEQRGSRAERWAAVDWARQEATFSGGQRAVAVTGMQDRLSVLIQLGMMARSNPQAFAPGMKVPVHELTPTDVQVTAYLVRGEEILDIGERSYRTLKIERVEPRKADDPVFEAWLAYDLGMLPIRLRATDASGRSLDQVLSN